MNESPNDEILAPESILDAAQRIAGLVVKTPVIESERLDAEIGARLRFKCENLQRIGAFKYRGATNAVQSLSDQAASCGVATHSSGNHGAALARAARERGIPAHIVVPKGSVPEKVQAIETYGGRLTFCENNQAAREAGLANIVAETGARIVHPYDDSRVIAGQGTAAHELLSDVPDLDAIIAPIGGGGLIAGTTLACRLHGRGVDVFGAEPEGADDTFRSVQQGSIVRDFSPNTIADGLRARVGDLTFPMIQSDVKQVLTVSDKEIVAAMRRCWERLHLIIEASCATVLAAIFRYPELFRGRHVGVILSGGNVSLDNLPWQH